MSPLNTLIKEDSLCVISDIHLGNPSFIQSKGFVSFLEHLSEQKTTLCINGDGFDLLQISFPKLMLDLPSVLKNISDFISVSGNKVYYIIGNHDINLENFLEDANILNVVPFLDVVSGGRRIRIEHGHLYDRFFINHPVLYTEMTKFAGMLLKLTPRIFHLYDKSTHYMASLMKNKKNQPGDAPVDKRYYLDAVNGLFERGFDAVIFGHTHRPGLYKMDGDKRYANTGSWIGTKGYYIKIENGDISLLQWKN